MDWTDTEDGNDQERLVSGYGPDSYLTCIEDKPSVFISTGIHMRSFNYKFSN